MKRVSGKRGTISAGVNVPEDIQASEARQRKKTNDLRRSECPKGHSSERRAAAVDDAITGLIDKAKDWFKNRRTTQDQQTGADGMTDNEKNEEEDPYKKGPDNRTAISAFFLNLIPVKIL